jgi:ferric-dicitrate binding protein FerR (iron transport regulator)
VQAEFEARHGRAVTHRRSPWIALAAAVAGVAVLAAILFSSSGDGSSVGVVSSARNGGLRYLTAGVLSREIGVGDEVPTGQRVTSTGNSLVALSQGGALRIAPGTALQVIGIREVLLQSGRVFLDFPRNADAFVVRTSAGTIEHVGTQFEVSAGAVGTRIRVREGSVRMHTASDSRVFEAGAEVFITNGGTVTRRNIPTYGEDWEWAESMAPDFDIENRELNDVLNWVARETGRHVEFSDEQAREIASQTRLHGSIRGLAPLEALDRVLSTTSLRFEVRGDVIRVSSHR